MLPTHRCYSSDYGCCMAICLMLELFRFVVAIAGSTRPRPPPTARPTSTLAQRPCFKPLTIPTKLQTLSPSPQCTKPAFSLWLKTCSEKYCPANPLNYELTTVPFSILPFDDFKPRLLRTCVCFVSLTLRLVEKRICQKPLSVSVFTSLGKAQDARKTTLHN